MFAAHPQVAETQLEERIGDVCPHAFEHLGDAREEWVADGKLAEEPARRRAEVHDVVLAEAIAGSRQLAVLHLRFDGGLAQPRGGGGQHAQGIADLEFFGDAQLDPLVDGDASAHPRVPALGGAIDGATLGEWLEE